MPQKNDPAPADLEDPRPDVPDGDVSPVTKRLPDFVILGAQKAGTTSLFAYLAAHPAITPPAQKEIHFFDRQWNLGVDWYLKQFPQDLPAGHLTGEATPYYLYHPLAPERLAAVLPRARLLVLLRDPVARAISHFHYARSIEREPLASLEEALAAEPGRMAGQAEALSTGAVDLSFAHQNHSYVDRGRYCPQIRRWFACLPREQFLFLRAETFFAKPHHVLAQVCDFLGIEPPPQMDFRPHNPGDYPPAPPALLARLAAEFREDQAELVSLLGAQFPESV